MGFLNKLSHQYAVHLSVAFVVIVMQMLDQILDATPDAFIDYLVPMINVSVLALFCILTHFFLAPHIKKNWLLYITTILTANFLAVLLDFNLDYFFINDGIQRFSDRVFIEEYAHDMVYTITYWGFSTLIDHIFHRRQEKLRQETVHETSINQTGFLKDLPAHWNANVDIIEAQENYINLYQGDKKHTILYKFKDSIAEMGDAVGLQVHRSYWVRHSIIADFHKKQGRGEITTICGRKIPVSRTYLKDVERHL